MDVATGDISRFQPVQNNHCEQIAALIGNETAEHTEKARIKAAGKAEKRAAKAAANVAPGRSRFLPVRRPSRSVQNTDDSAPNNGRQMFEATMSRHASRSGIRSASPSIDNRHSSLRSSFDTTDGEARERSRSVTSSKTVSEARDSVRSSGRLSNEFWHCSFTRNRLKVSKPGSLVVSSSGGGMVSPCSSGEYGGEARGSEERSYPLLIDMLSNKCAAPFDLKSFLRFAKRHWMDENVMFYLEVNSFKMSGGGEMEYLTRVKRIYDMYIAPASGREVNISGAVSIKTSAAVSTVLTGRVGNGEKMLIGDVAQSHRSPVARDEKANCGKHRIRSGDNAKSRVAASSTPPPPPPPRLLASASMRPSVRRDKPPEGGTTCPKPGIGKSRSLPTGSPPPLPLRPASVEGISKRDEQADQPATLVPEKVKPEAVKQAPPPGDVEPSLGDTLEIRVRVDALGAGDDSSTSTDNETETSRRRSYSHVDEKWIDPPWKATASGDGDEDEWSTADIKHLLEVEVGGFGDRSIFDSAQREIVDLLSRDAYPKFVAQCLARTGVCGDH